MKIKKLIKYYTPITIMSGLLIISVFSCTEKLDAPFEDETFTSDVDYTKGDDMILPLLGAYYKFYDRTWDGALTYSIRGDDVNAAGDQVPMQEQDRFIYQASHWNINAFWQHQYDAIINCFIEMDEIEKYRPAANNDALADQYIAECKVIRAWEYLTLAKTFGGCIVIDQLDNIQSTPVSNKEEVMQYIVDEMAEAIPDLPPVHPNKRSDVKGGITQYTAYAIQAMAYQEMKDYQGVVDATSEIINSGEYQLSSDFYHLFRLAGKLDDENILEFQFSAFNQGEGDQFRHGFNPYGLAWNPVRTGAGGGWGFYEPTKKYIKFMLDRGETVRLETTVHWTPDGMTEIENEWGELPGWIDNFNREGDEFINNARKKWGAGKYIQPSTELIEGRTLPGSNKNFIVIRYSEILLMYAEALTRGATSSISMTADQAVNLVRTRAGLGTLTGVTTQQVLDEKFAELGTEWGIRFFDMVRTENTSELSHEGKTFTMDKAYLPFPAVQVSELPQLANGIQ
ncbi:MAG: RagB/SusD family nutrient uptake outer membrane protein [Bacteroidota bacterium]